MSNLYPNIEFTVNLPSGELNQLSAWFPTVIDQYTNLKQGDTFNLYGKQAIHLKKLVDTQSAPFTYKFVPYPIITSVTPSTDYISGNKLITIKGSNLSGVRSVRFGLYVSQWFTVVDDNTIIAYDYPYPEAATVDVIVNNGQDSNKLGVQLSYVTNAIVGDSVKYTFDGLPLGIVSGPDGNLWVADNSGSVWKVTTSGVRTKYVLAGSNPQNLCVGPDGNIWVNDNNDRIWKVELDGVVTAYNIAGAVGSGFLGIGAGADGNLWVTDGNDFVTGKIWRISTSGVATAFNCPTGYTPWVDIVPGPDGNMWFTLFPNSAPGLLAKITPAGVITTYATGLFDPNTLFVGQDNNLVLITSTSTVSSPPFNIPPTVARYNTAGQLLSSYSFNAIDPGIACVGPDGLIYCGVILTTTPSFTFGLMRFDINKGVVEDLPAGNGGVGGVCVGPDGNIWVADESGAVWKVS